MTKHQQWILSLLNEGGKILFFENDNTICLSDKYLNDYRITKTTFALLKSDSLIQPVCNPMLGCTEYNTLKQIKHLTNKVLKP